MKETGKLSNKAKAALYRIWGTTERTNETLKAITIGTWMTSGTIVLAKQIGNIMSQAGILAATGAAGLFVGVDAIAAKIIDKYFRKQIFSNTMDEASERAYKMLLLTIKSLLQEGKSEKEIIRYLGELNGPQSQVFAEEFNKAVKEAELDGAYRR